MGSIHELAKGSDIALLQSFHRADRAGIFEGCMFGALIEHGVRQCPFPRLEFFRCQGAKRIELLPLLFRSLQQGERFLAFRPAGIVFGGSKLVLHLAVRNDDLFIAHGQWRIFKMKRIGIKENGVIRFPHRRSELVHDAAVHSDVDIFRSLAKQSQILLLHTLKSEQVAKDKAGQDFQGSRGGQAGACGDIAVEQDVQTRIESAAFFRKCPDNALRIIGPVTGPKSQFAAPVRGSPASVKVKRGIIQGEFLYFAADIHGCKTDVAVITFFRRRIGSDRQCAGEHMAAVIVRVLANEVHTSRRKIQGCRLRTVKLHEFLFHFFLNIF